MRQAVAERPGHPESHGREHLPSEFARLLFDASPDGIVGHMDDASIPARRSGVQLAVLSSHPGE